MRKKIALITGISGQDGSYLAEILIKKNYIVHGIVRKSSLINTSRLDHIYEGIEIKNRKLFLHYGDMTDGVLLLSIIKKILPDEIYNLAAQSHVAVSFENPLYTSDVNAFGTLRILEAIKSMQPKKKIKFYQASTSEMYGLTSEKYQNENTPFRPRSPYGASKLFSYWNTKIYREAYGIYASNGILFNHESPRRGETFVTRKITIGLSKIAHGLQKTIYLGNLNSLRDWGHAQDYAYMQWKILQQKKPDDYVIATGTQYSIRDFINLCCKELGVKISFRGKGVNEVGSVSSVKKGNKYNFRVGDKIIKINKKYFRKLEVPNLLGDSKKARIALKFHLQKNTKMLAKEMINSDLKIYEKIKFLEDNYKSK